MSTNPESLVKIGLVVAEIFGVICRFLAYRRKTRVISKVTGPIFIKFAHDVGKILPLNIFKSE